MDLKTAGTSFLKGCFDSVRGISAIFLSNNEIDERTRRMSPFRNSNFRGLTPEQINKTPAKLDGKSKLRSGIINCTLLNGVIFLLSILLFNLVILPSINVSMYVILGKDMAKSIWTWIEPILSLIFHSLLVIPIYLLCKIINNFYFQDIADSIYRSSRGRPISFNSVSVLIADLIFSLVVQSLFLLQTTLVSYIPIYPLAYLFSMVHMCLLYSLYAFEYKWFNMGWELHRRLAYIERNWPYFIGFGLPLAVITQLSNSWVISGGLFALLFQFFIISANEANPVDDICIFQLPLFSAVVGVSNVIFSNFIGWRKSTNEATRPQRSTSRASLGPKFKREK